MPTPLGDFHHPDTLSEWRGFDEKYEEAIALVKDGVPAEHACKAVWGISPRTFLNWRTWAMEDMEAGFDASESNLIKLIQGMAKIDVNLHRKLSKTAMALAVEDKNPNMVQFLLKTKYGYSEKTKSEVEITADDTPIQFNIVDMTPNDENEE